MASDEELDVIADRRSRSGNPVHILIRVGADLHLHARKAGISPACELGYELVTVVAGESPRAVDRDSITSPAEQVAKRHLQEPGTKIPEGGVDGRDRVRHNAFASDVANDLQHRAPAALGREDVRADDASRRGRVE